MPLLPIELAVYDLIAGPAGMLALAALAGGIVWRLTEGD